MCAWMPGGLCSPEAPSLSVSPQSPSPAMLSILVISGSAATSALHARLMEALKDATSGALSVAARRLACGEIVVISCGVCGICDARVDTDAVLDDHFHPGVSAGSSRSPRSKSVDGAFASLLPGSRKRVSENPGMLRLV